MGQYYHAVVLPPLSAKLEITAAYDPHSYDSFSKQTEHSWMGNHFVQTVESFFMPGEKFYKHRLVWAGDYADDESGRNKNLYDLCERKMEKTPVRRVKKAFRYLVNHTQKVYLDKTKMPVKDGWQVHPLPLLTCESGGGGCGDYFHKDSEVMKHVGSWARDIISVETTFPANYQELTVVFEPR